MSDQCCTHLALFATPLELRVLSFSSLAACAQKMSVKIMLFQINAMERPKSSLLLLFATIIVISDFDEHHFPPLGLSRAAPAHNIEPP